MSDEKSKLLFAILVTVLEGCVHRAPPQAMPPRPCAPSNEVVRQQTPSRDDVGETMHRVQAEIEKCVDRRLQVVVKFVFKGTGCPESAEIVQGGHPDSTRIDDRELETCIESAAMNARSRPFAQDRFRVVFPFRLRW